MTPLSKLLVGAIDESGRTARDVAHEANVNEVQISRYRGGEEPTAAVLARVLDVLGYDVALVPARK